MLKYVSPGQKITADGYNALVDAVGGPQVPTSKGYIRTQDGSILQEWSNLDAQANMRTIEVFKCTTGPNLRVITGTDPWDDWELGSVAQSDFHPTEKHIYMHLGVDDFMLSLGTSEPVFGRNSELVCNGMPTIFIGWSFGKYHHIVTDKDILVNDKPTVFDGYGIKRQNDSDKIYHGWIETPFQPNALTTLYGTFYKLLKQDEQGNGSFIGTIFIITCHGNQIIDNTTKTLYPFHSFTQFESPEGGIYIVGEQCSIPTPICEMQQSTAMPGDDALSSANLMSSKLVQHHTGPLVYEQNYPEAQGAWSVLCFPYGNENGDQYNIAAWPEMKLTNTQLSSAPTLEDFKVIDTGQQKYLYVKNFQTAGKQVLIELDSSNPIREGLLSKEVLEQATMPFVNICDNGKVFSYTHLPGKDAYLVLPGDDYLVTVDGTGNTDSGIYAQYYLRGHYYWNRALNAFELLLLQGGDPRTYSHKPNEVMMCDIMFDGRQLYAWHVPQNAILQGSFSNLTRDWNIPDMDTCWDSTLSDVTLKWTVSLGWSDLKAAKTEDGTTMFQSDMVYDKLSAAHPAALQIYKFNDFSYKTDLSDVMLSGEDTLSGYDVILRHRHPLLSGEHIPGGAVEYIPLCTLLSNEVCDSEISSLNLSSVQHLSTDEGQMALELFNFHELNAKTEPILSSQDVLVRELGEDSSVTLKYLPLSSISSAADVDVDAQYTSTKTPHRYSIDWMPDADNNDKVLQMYRFDESPSTYQYQLRFNDDAQIPQNSISADFVVREYYADAGGVETELNYQDGKEVVVPHEDTDALRYAQTGNGHMSINYAQGQQGEPKALQLYNFSSYGTTSEVNGLSAAGDGVLIRKKSSVDNHLELQYLNIVGLRKLVGMPSLSALDGLSVVTGIEYPMTGTNQYKIVAHRKQFNVVNNVLTITNLTDQTIDTVAHDTIYPNS